MKAPTYRWTCNACEKVVESGLSACSHCGCPAGANTIDTEQFKDKKSWLVLLNKRGFEKLMSIVIMGPMFIFLTGFNQQYLHSFLLILALVSALFFNIKHIKKSFVIKSYNLIVILYSVANLAFMVSRVTIVDSGGAIFAFSVFELVGLCYLYWGKDGKKVRQNYCVSVGNA